MSFSKSPLFFVMTADDEEQLVSLSQVANTADEKLQEQGYQLEELLGSAGRSFLGGVRPHRPLTARPTSRLARRQAVAVGV